MIFNSNVFKYIFTNNTESYFKITKVIILVWNNLILKSQQTYSMSKVPFIIFPKQL